LNTGSTFRLRFQIIRIHKKGAQCTLLKKKGSSIGMKAKVHAARQKPYYILTKIKRFNQHIAGEKVSQSENSWQIYSIIG